jgi:hypothetical protein
MVTGEELPPIEWVAPIPVEIFQLAISVEKLSVTGDGAMHTFIAIPPNAVLVKFSIEGSDVRYTETGDAVTATTGLRLPAGAIITVYSRKALQALQFVSVGAVAATINAIYYAIKSPDLDDLLSIYPGLP